MRFNDHESMLPGHAGLTHTILMEAFPDKTCGVVCGVALVKLGRLAAKSFAALIGSLVLLVSPQAVWSQVGTTPDATATIASPQEIQIQAGWLLDVPGQPPKRKQTIVIRDGRIVAVRAGFAAAPARTTHEVAVRAPTQVKVIDLRDAYVLPGLIDCHVHLTAELTEAELGAADQLQTVTLDSVARALDGVVFARRTLEAGFTTVRDLGADPSAIFGLRNAIEAGKIPGPRIVAAGAALSITGGDGDIKGFRPDLVFASENICDGADDCRRAVRRQIKLGADVIKVIAAGGSLGPATGGSRQLSDDELTEIVRSAHELDRKVAAHAHSAAGIRAALRAGVDSIEHGTYSDQEAFDLFRSRGAFLVPTLLAGRVLADTAVKLPGLPEALKAQATQLGARMSSAVGRAYRAGVKIAFGSDTAVSPHGQNAKEFPLMVAAGMSPMAAIQAATVNASQLLGLAAEVGTIEVGKRADIIAMRADPLADVSALTEPRFVMRSGVVYR